MTYVSPRAQTEKWVCSSLGAELPDSQSQNSLASLGGTPSPCTTTKCLLKAALLLALSKSDRAEAGQRPAGRHIVGVHSPVDNSGLHYEGYDQKKPASEAST